MRLNPLGVALVLLVGAVSGVAAADNATIPGIAAHLRASQHIPINNPIWVQFSIENTTNEPVTLTVPGCEPAIPSPEMGLPLAHVFSGAPGTSSSVQITTESGRHWDQPVGYRTPSHAPILLLAPRSTVGTTLDLREYFPSLRGAGQFRLTWKPYAAGVTSETVLLTIAPRKQVEMETDDGTLKISLFYDDAPQHVANFLELAKSGFYTGKVFHRLEPGYMIQGGCPRSDGTGIRLDGKRIPAEFNNHPHQKGSVSMALLDDDPDSGSCQFFISNTRQKDWDGRYTVFGELSGEESLQTLDRLMACPIDDQSRPKRALYIRTVRIVDAPVETP